MGGIPDKLFKFEALLKKAMETLRADYKILETGGYSPLIKKANCDISVLFGNNDTLSESSDMTKVNYGSSLRLLGELCF